MEEVSRACQTIAKANHIEGYQVVQRRLIIKEDDDDDLVVQVRSSDKSRKSIGKVDSDVSSASEDNTSLMEDDPSIVRIPWAIMSLRMAKLVPRYGVPPNYIYKIPGDDKYVSRSSPLEVAICGRLF